MYDIIVIGAGPAGMTAALYALRADKSVLVIEKGSFGGQITFSPKVENYPGFIEMSGNEFADKLLDQIMAQGAEIELGKVTEIKNLPDRKVVVTEDASFEAKAVIIATGVKHRMLGIEGEEDFVGNGISFCAVCDGAFYQGQHVAVIGGGNTALQEIALLSEVCTRVTVVQNLAALTGEEKMIRALEAKSNIDYLYRTVVTGYEGENALTALRLLNTETNETSRLAVDGAFLAIGTAPDNGAFADVAELDAAGYVVAGESGETRTPGVFVAGDCRTKTYRQVATAISDGAAAALNACRYLDRI